MAVMANMAVSNTDDVDDGGGDDGYHHDGDDLRTLSSLIADAKLTTSVVYQHDDGHSARHHFG